MKNKVVIFISSNCIKSCNKVISKLEQIPGSFQYVYKCVYNKWKYALDIQMVLFVLNQVLNLLVVLEEMKINVDLFDGFVLLDQLYLVALVDMQMGYPTDYPVLVISVRSTMDAMEHGNAAYKSVVYCVTMTFVMLKWAKRKHRKEIKMLNSIRIFFFVLYSNKLIKK